MPSNGVKPPMVFAKWDEVGEHYANRRERLSMVMRFPTTRAVKNPAIGACEKKEPELRARVAFVGLVRQREHPDRS